jgi:hypothetical protein
MRYARAARVRVVPGVENIDHTRTRAKTPQTNGIGGRFHRTVLNEFYRVAFRRKIYRDLEELQTDLDQWLKEYNEARSHQGRWCYGKTRCRPSSTRFRWPKRKYFPPPLRRGRNSEYYSIAMSTMAAGYNRTINSNRTPRTLTIDRQRKS